MLGKLSVVQIIEAMDQPMIDGVNAEFVSKAAQSQDQQAQPLGTVEQDTGGSKKLKRQVGTCRPHTFVPASEQYMALSRHIAEAVRSALLF